MARGTRAATRADLPRDHLGERCAVRGVEVRIDLVEDVERSGVAPGVRKIRCEMEQGRA